VSPRQFVFSPLFFFCPNSTVTVVHRHHALIFSFLSSLFLSSSCDFFFRVASILFLFGFASVCSEIGSMTFVRHAAYPLLDDVVEGFRRRRCVRATWGACVKGRANLERACLLRASRRHGVEGRGD
jgi:hypothetical protein